MPALSYMLHILHFQVITLVLSYSKEKLHSTRESRKRKKYNQLQEKDQPKMLSYQETITPSVDPFTDSH